MIKKYFFMGVLFFTCITTSLFSQSTSKKTVATIEYEALVDFYNAMNGKNWYDKWDVSTNNLHEGSWYGVSIEDGHIVSISLHRNNLSGSIPKSFSNLKYLRSLDLGGFLSSTDLNNLSGLERLEYLDLSYCELKGEIPSSWGKLLKLKEIHLNNNNLSGSIFKEIGELKKLEKVYFQDNQFTSIPSTISNLLKLKELNVSSNKLTGDLPKSLESLTSLTSLDVSYNQLSGINAFLPSKVSLNLRSQTLELPELVYKGKDVVVSNLPKITKYNRDKNDFSHEPSFYLHIRGSNVATIKVNSKGELVLPKAHFLSLKKGDEVYIRQHYSNIRINFKKITIDLPKVSKTEYEALVDFYNAMNGKNWSTKWDVSTNNLHKGSWYGVSIEDGHIVSISLPSNNISGSIPKSFSNLKYLRSLDLGGFLSSTDLNNLSGLERLEYLDLSYCKLKGEIPSSWGKLRKLKDIHLNNNNLSGPIFKEIGELKKLEKVYFQGNQFTGIPSTISKLLKLKELDLSYNELTGDLPKSLESLTSLTSLDVDYNQLSGINAFLPSKVSLNFNYQTLELPELVYKGKDVVISNLPKITKYNRDKNDFSHEPSFYLHIRGSNVATIKVNSKGELVLPKAHFLSLKKGDEVYLQQYYRGTRINFKKITIDLPKVSKKEYEALVDFYNAMNGKNWSNKWDVSTNNLHEGSWYGISIEDGHVVSISLHTNNISGSIPKSFSNLKYLRSLDLAGYNSHDLSSTDLNNLSGLERLEYLDLSYCKLKGEIPSSWGKMQKLKELYLNNNAIEDVNLSFSKLHLKGVNFKYQSVKKEFVKVGGSKVIIDLPRYSVLRFKNDALIFNAKNEFRLYVNDSHKKTAFSNDGKLVFDNIDLLKLKETDKLKIYQVDGVAQYSNIYYDKVSFGKPLVANEFEILKKIYTSTNGKEWKQKWDISKNNLNKESWFGVSIEDGHVVALNLFNNNLVGKIPEEVSQLKKLKVLKLSNNKISGALPKNIHSLTQLEILEVSSNELSGVISSRIAELEKLKTFAIGNNKFKGTIPTALSDFKSLAHLDISSNGFDKIEKKLYYDFSKTYIDLRNQRIKYDKILILNGNKLKVILDDIVKYDLEKNNYKAKNKFSLLVDNLTHDTTVVNDKGEIIFNNVRISEIPDGVPITVRQTTGSFLNSEFTFSGIEDKSKVPVVESEYLVLKEVYKTLNGNGWKNKWNVTANNLHKKKWFGVTTYDGHVVGIDLNANNLTGSITGTTFKKLPYLTSLNLSSNKITAIKGIIPSKIKLELDRQVINVGKLGLNKEAVIKDFSINRYDHKQKKYINQTYSLRIGDFSRTLNMSKEGVKLVDLMYRWKVKKGEKIILRQTTGNAINSVINYEIDFKDGDANLDGAVNVLDVQTTLNKIMGNYVQYFNYYAADINSDTTISILDVVKQVSIIQSNNVMTERYLSAKQYHNNVNNPKVKLSVVDNQLILDTGANEVSSFELRINALQKSDITEKLSDLGFTVSVKEQGEQLSILAFSLATPLRGKETLAILKKNDISLAYALFTNKELQELSYEFIPNNTLTVFDGELKKWGEIKNYPNPFKENTTIQFYLKEKQQQVTLLLFDMTGRKVFVENIPAVLGVNNYVFTRKKLPSGVYNYIIKLKINGKKLKGKMIIE